MWDTRKRHSAGGTRPHFEFRSGLCFVFIFPSYAPASNPHMHAHCPDPRHLDIAAPEARSICAWPAGEDALSADADGQMTLVCHWYAIGQP